MDCLFCSLATESGTRAKPEDQILAESRFFYAKPGLGHFAKGYILINSRSHVQSMSHLSTQALTDLEHIKGVIQDRLHSLLGHGSVAFEHGDVNPDYHPGCCLEHAHLHILPVPDRIRDDLHLPFEMTQISSLLDLQHFAQQNISYLLYEDRSRSKYVYHIKNNLPSQYLRREFCKRFGLEDYWDWGVFPFRKGIDDFLSSYREHANFMQWSTRISL